MTKVEVAQDPDGSGSNVGVFNPRRIYTAVRCRSSVPHMLAICSLSGGIKNNVEDIKSLHDCWRRTAAAPVALLYRIPGFWGVTAYQT
jgi:hypothetical protein